MSSEYIKLTFQITYFSIFYASIYNFFDVKMFQSKFRVAHDEWISQNLLISQIIVWIFLNLLQRIYTLMSTVNSLERLEQSMWQCDIKLTKTRGIDSLCFLCAVNRTLLPTQHWPANTFCIVLIERICGICYRFAFFSHLFMLSIVHCCGPNSQPPTQSI